jgi:ubiquinone/menaquinone biosynthesis C-methylase UbiE
MTSFIPANVARFSGLADVYDRYRPSPPAVMVDILTQMAQVQRPRLVVDLGAGTGLSTRIWAGRADRVIGIEPNPDMRLQAVKATPAEAGISYQEGASTQTHLPDGCADVVTCCQALHWMDPPPTFAEVARLLRPGGLFAACDCDWPPTMHWQVEAAYLAFVQRVRKIEKRRRFAQGVRKWAKEEHLKRMKDSGRFRFVREVLACQKELGDAERLVGLAMSQGGAAALLKNGLSEEEIGLTELRAVARQILGDTAIPWYFSFRVRIGIK